VDKATDSNLASMLSVRDNMTIGAPAPITAEVTFL
jgi:hypothetical protein